MSNLSIPKRIVAIAVIAIVLLLPVYLAYNAQSAAMAPDTSGFQAAPDDRDEINILSQDDVKNILDPGADKGNPVSKASPDVQQKTSETNVIDSVRITPTPKPIPTPTPKWEPEYPATNGKLIMGDLVEKDSVNVLIIGVDRTAYLFDTVGIVSISVEKKTVKIIMFPRDLFIAYSDDVMALVKKIRHNNLPGEYKLNNTYNVAKNTEKYSKATYNRGRFNNHSFDFLAQVIYEKFDILADDFVRINTYGLVKLVDQFGGVRVYVPMYMRYHDPDQNLTINIPKGSQVLNGKQAEGFVRFRQGYDSKGNFSVTADRTKNQLAFLKAFYEQHAKLRNIDKIPGVIDTLKKNIIHSVTMDDVFTKYIDLLTDVVNEKYEFIPVQFETKGVHRLGSTYNDIKGLAKDD